MSRGRRCTNEGTEQAYVSKSAVNPNHHTGEGREQCEDILQTPREQKRAGCMPGPGLPPRGAERK